MKIHLWNGVQSKLALFWVHKFVHFEILTGSGPGAPGSRWIRINQWRNPAKLRFYEICPEISTQNWNKAKYLKVFLSSLDSLFLPLKQINRVKCLFGFFISPPVLQPANPQKPKNPDGCHTAKERKPLSFNHSSSRSPPERMTDLQNYSISAKQSLEKKGEKSNSERWHLLMTRSRWAGTPSVGHEGTTPDLWDEMQPNSLGRGKTHWK